MDYRILDLFMKENDAWEDMIARQKVELPALDKMISNIVADKHVKAETERVFEHLRHEMEVQGKHMEDLEKELEKQQKLNLKRFIIYGLKKFQLRNQANEKIYLI